MISFKLILTTFKASFVFVAAGAVVKIGSSLPPWGKFSLPKSVKRSAVLNFVHKTSLYQCIIKKYFFLDEKRAFGVSNRRRSELKIWNLDSIKSVILRLRK